jgi:4-amino-4-deoxy-L-arabinose transferase-like glycosyltransferase
VTAASASNRGRLAVALALTVVVLGGIGAWLATSEGPVVTSDSVVFLDAAENVRSGSGVVLSGSYPNLEPTLRDRPGFPLVHWPPLYPGALAAVSAVAGDPVEGARVLQALLLAGNLALFGLLVWRLTGSRLGAVAAMAVLALSPAGVERHLDIASEPLFMLLLFSGLESLALYLTRRGAGWLVAAVSFLSAALLTRYAGLPVLVVVFGLLLAFGTGSSARRLARAGSVTAAVAAPLGLWLVRNAADAGTATGREVGWHLPGADDVRSAFGYVAGWFAPMGFPAVLRAAAAFLVIALFVAVLRPIPHRLVSLRERVVRVAALVGFSAAYLVFLVVSRTIADSENPLDDRGFAPAYFALAAVGAAAVVHALARGEDGVGFGRRACVAAAIVVVVASYAATTAQEIRNVDDTGYLGRRWRGSETLARVRTLPHSQTIFSDEPEAILFLLDRRASSIPVRDDPIADRPHSRYADELRRLRARIARGAGVVVLFDGERREYLPDDEELLARAGLVRLRRAVDGALYGPSAPGWVLRPRRGARLDPRGPRRLPSASVSWRA